MGGAGWGEGVSMGLTVGRSPLLLPLAIKWKKISSGFSMEIHLEDRFFIIEIRFCFSCFYAKSEICISKYKSGFTNRKLSTQNLRAVFLIFHKYSRLFWTLLNRNKIIFYWFTHVSTFWDTFSPTITLEIVKRK